MRKIILIGGTDSSGGAGLTRDASIAHALGFDVLPVVTAVTAQTDQQLIEVRPMPIDLVAMQVSAAITSEGIKAIKIGMLGSREVADALGELLSGLPVPIVLDPVLKSSSGGSLLRGSLPWPLLSRVDLVTPNLAEASILADGLETDEQMAAVGNRILSRGVRAVLIKGGHGSGKVASDVLLSKSGQHIFEAQRLPTDLRGTGCALATAIACHLAQGCTLQAACQKAKMHVHSSLQNASYVGNRSIET